MTKASMPFRYPLRLAAVAALALALGGCISLDKAKVPEKLITLAPQAAAPAGTAVSGKVDQALVVLDPETDRRLAVQRVAVTVDEASVAYLKDAMWVERPSRLFRSLLAETIRARGGRLVFEDGDAAARGGSRLAGRLVDIGYDDGTRAVVVRYDAVLEAPGGEITTQRFEAREDGVKPNAEAVGPALNRAANEVARQVADWVG